MRADRRRRDGRTSQRAAPARPAASQGNHIGVSSTLLTRSCMPRHCRELLCAALCAPAPAAIRQCAPEHVRQPTQRPARSGWLGGGSGSPTHGRGLGVGEGRIVIPPINGKYLLREGSTDALAMAHRGTEAATPRRSRYNAETLARAIRDGIDPDGRTLDYLMPRFALDDASMQLLIGYLREPSSHPAPGALTDSLQFA